MAPENNPLEKEIPIRTIIFRGELDVPTFLHVEAQVVPIFHRW